MRNLAIILPLKPNFFGKLQRFSAIDGSINMPNNSWIFKNSIKMKDFEALYKVQTPSRLKKIIQPHSSGTSFLCLWNKNFNIKTFAS